MSRLYVGSEIGTLKRVLVHRPERALDHLTPSNYRDLLFDDVLSVSRAAEEHDVFVETLEKQGVEVLHLHDLLKETLEDESAKNWLLNAQIHPLRFGNQLAQEVRQFLTTHQEDEIAHFLLGGLSFTDFPVRSRSMLAAQAKPTDFIIDPLPNHLFTRDTSSWIYDGVSLNTMALPARKRETRHLQAIYQWHPLFKDQAFHLYLDETNKAPDHAHIEGGDILILGHETLLIGMSERTTAQGVEALATELFAKGSVKQIICLELPKHRACMHLDTVFTQINVDTFSIYPPIIRDDLPCWTLSPKDNGIHFQRELNYRKALEKALKLDQIQHITTGGDNFTAEREQWNDANNLLTIRPNVVISYEGNQATNEKYDKAGVEVLTIPGDQLGRGRGGARCMSCPIERESVNF